MRGFQIHILEQNIYMHQIGIVGVPVLCKSGIAFFQVVDVTNPGFVERPIERPVDTKYRWMAENGLSAES